MSRYIGYAPWAELINGIPSKCFAWFKHVRGDMFQSVPNIDVILVGVFAVDYAFQIAFHLKKTLNW